MTGKRFILSAPSGTGKTTLVKELLGRFPDLKYSVSHTTRPPRPGEVDGKDYFFITPKEFKEKLEENRWAEWAEVHGNFYGTSADVIDAEISAGVDVLLDIDVQGAEQILARYPQDTVTIFIEPPSIEALRQRLLARGTDSPAVIEKRLQNAVEEMAHKELYRHVIVNDRLPEAIRELVSLVEAYRTQNGEGS